MRVERHEGPRLRFSLAQANIVEQWSAFIGAIVVLALAGSLVFIAVGVSVANVRSFTSFERSLPADLYVKHVLDEWEAVPASLVFEIGAFDEVDLVEPYVPTVLDKQVHFEGYEAFVGLRVIDHENSPLTVPSILGDRAASALATPNTVILSQVIADRLRVIAGDVILVGEARIALRVVGILGGELGRADLSGESRNSFISAETADLIDTEGQRSASFSENAPILVRLAPGVELEPFRARLNEMLNPQDLEAITPAENQGGIALSGVLRNSGFQGFIVVGAFAAIIPLIIVTQTLKNVIVAQRTQFATLRALGAPFSRLSRVAMEQALWVGLVGAALAYILASVVKVILFSRGIVLHIPLGVVLPVAAALTVASLLAGVFSVLAIRKARPVELLR